MIDVHGTLIGLCGIGVVAGQEGDPLARVRVQADIERAAIPILLLHAPIEGVTPSSSLLDTRAQVSRSNLMRLSAFKYIFAGYHHAHSRISVGQSEVVFPGATQHMDFSNPDSAPGFVFMGLAADGIRWCNHIQVNSWSLQRLVISTRDLWPDKVPAETQAENGQAHLDPTEIILERLRPLCSADAMIQLRLEGELTRRQYHQLDLIQIRRYGEEHSFALAIDDSALALIPEQDAPSVETGERLSPREELIALADEWIADTTDAQEKKALQTTKEELLFAMDDIKGKR